MLHCNMVRAWGGGGPAGGGTGHEGFTHKFFYFLKLGAHTQSFATQPNAGYSDRMTWHSLPNAPRKLQATEARLDAIYAAARNGLKGDALALAAGLLPSEYRQLCQFDPLAELAEQKGRADGEMEVSGILHEAARLGDAKAALEILKHAHGWTAKTAIDVNIDQTISVKHALELAQQRVIEGAFSVVEQLEDNNRASTHLFGTGRNGADGAAVDAQLERRPAEVRPVHVPVGAEGDAA